MGCIIGFCSISLCRQVWDFVFQPLWSSWTPRSASHCVSKLNSGQGVKNAIRQKCRQREKQKMKHNRSLFAFTSSIFTPARALLTQEPLKLNQKWVNNHLIPFFFKISSSKLFWELRNWEPFATLLWAKLFAFLYLSLLEILFFCVSRGRRSGIEVGICVIKGLFWSNRAWKTWILVVMRLCVQTALN